MAVTSTMLILQRQALLATQPNAYLEHCSRQLGFGYVPTKVVVRISARRAFHGLSDGIKHSSLSEVRLLGMILPPVQ